MPRPLHIPDYQIRKNLFTPGGEFIILNLKGPDALPVEYIGYYHEYPNGSVYSEAEYDRLSSFELIRPPEPFFDPATQRYALITGIETDQYTVPRYSLPTVTPKDVRRGTIQRYIVQQRNNLTNIVEIDRQQYNSINTSNRLGIDGNRYNGTAITWTISGPRDEAQKANTRVLVAAETTIPGIRMYLSDPLEFYQQ